MFGDLRLFAERRICSYRPKVAHTKERKMSTEIGWLGTFICFIPLFKSYYYLVWKGFNTIANLIVISHELIVELIGVKNALP